MRRPCVSTGLWAISACLFTVCFPVNVTAGKFVEATVVGVLAVVCFVVAWRSP
jgi:hypothetical protein